MSYARDELDVHHYYRLGGLAVVLLFLVGFTLAVLATAPATAAPVEVENSTIVVDADTDTAYADLNNTNTTAAANGTVYFYGVENASGAAVETEISNTSFSVAASSTQLVESAAVNGTLYDEVRIVVEADNTSIASPSTELLVDVGTFQQVSGGGGGTGGGGLNLGTTEWLVLVVALGGVLLLMTKED